MTPENKILFRKHLHEGGFKACLKMNEATFQVDANPNNKDAELKLAYWTGAYFALKGALEHFDEVS